MATKTQYAAVLTAIKSAPNSIGVEMIATRSGLSQVIVRTIVSALCETRHIKENQSREGTFFTRTPMRPEIDAFLAAQSVTLTGVSFDADPVYPTTSTVDPLALFDRAHGMTAQALLYRIFSAPESHTVTNTTMVDKVNQLIELGLVRRHRDYSDRYFTIREKRDAIKKYIDGEISWATLIGENTDHNPGPVAPFTSTPTPAPREGVWVRFPYLEVAGQIREYRADQMGDRSPAPCDGPYYYGNYEQSYKSILERVFTYPHAIDSIRDVNATLLLVKMGFLRVHRDDNSLLFTEPTRRNDIKRYLAGEITLKQLFGIEPMPVPSPVETSPSALLRGIRNAPNAVAVPECEARFKLVDLKLIREHRDKPGFYFTMPDNRDIVDDYLAGEITWEGLTELSTGVFDDDSCPCCIEDPSDYALPVGGNPDVLALAQAVRNLADAIVRQNS